MATKLTKVELDEVSVVDRPANQYSRILIIKRDSACPLEKGSCPGPGAEGMCPVDKKACGTRGKKPTVTEKAAKGIQFSIGYKEGGGSDIQSVVFNTDAWTEEAARAWLKEHDLSSEKVDKPVSGNTLRFRQRDPSQYKRIRMITPGAQVAKVLRRSDSMQRVLDQIDRAVREKFFEKSTTGDPSLTAYVYVRDVFDDQVIFERTGELFRVEYEITELPNAELQVELGEKIPVEVVYQDIQVKKGEGESESSSEDTSSTASEVVPEEVLTELESRVERLRDVAQQFG